MGTPRKITGTDNNTAWQLPYSAFGENTATGILTATTNPQLAFTTDTATATKLATSNPLLTYNLRYPGQYFDDESKLNYNYFRSYQAGQGRYTQSDPIGLEGGWNKFGYVEANAVSNIDPLGLATYQCTRRLNNVPIRAGSFFHQYVCTGNAKDGYSCGGIGPSGNIFSSPAKLEQDKFKPEQCEKVEDDNACVEQCIAKQFTTSLPNYSVNLKSGDNCQTFANQIEATCKAQCRVRFK